MHFPCRCLLSSKICGSNFSFFPSTPHRRSSEPLNKQYLLILRSSSLRLAPKLPNCRVCGKKEGGKYRCPIDDVEYCSVVCFKKHKVDGCSTESSYTPAPLPLLPPSPTVNAVEDTRPRKRLKDLNWPAEPDSALWSDPLARDDIKPLRGIEYEALATSSHMRELLASKTLRATLDRLSSLPRHCQEASLRIALGLPPDPAPTTYRPSSSQKFSTSSQTPTATSNRGGGGRGRGRGGRGRGRGGAHHNGGGFGGNEDRELLETTPDERKEVEHFVEEIESVLHKIRVEKGERPE